MCTVSPHVLGPRLLLILMVWPTFSAWRAKAWATLPAPMMPISMVISFLLGTCSYNDPGLPWSRNVLDGFLEVLHMSVAKAPLCNLALWATTPIHRQKGSSLSDIKWISTLGAPSSARMASMVASSCASSVTSQGYPRVCAISRSSPASRSRLRASIATVYPRAQSGARAPHPFLARPQSPLRLDSLDSLSFPFFSTLQGETKLIPHTYPPALLTAAHVS